MLELGIWFCKNECYQLFLPVWQCSVINVISPAFLLEQHFTFQLIVAPSLCFRFHWPTYPFSFTCETYSPAYSCIFSLLSVTLPVLPVAQLWGVWNWKQKKEVWFAVSFPSPLARRAAHPCAALCDLHKMQTYQSTHKNLFYWRYQKCLTERFRELCVL